MVKGLGYSLEAMMAVIMILLFSLGVLQISSPDQDWSEYQRQVAAQDLTYSMQASGKLENFVKRGELGAFQDSVTTVSDRNMEVSGAVSDLPLYEFAIGYFTRPQNRSQEDLVEVSSGDRCYDDLEELEGFVDDPSADPIYRTERSSNDDLAHSSNYNVTLYFANTDPTGLDSPSVDDGYDTLWVDNSTSCQFSNSEGPFYLNQMFYWGDKNTGADEDFFDFKSIDIDQSAGQGEAEFYLATQAYNVKSMLENGVNGVRTEISLDAVDFSEIDSENHNALIFAERESLNQINQPGNLDILEDHMVSGTALMLMNPIESDMQTGILNQANFDWIDAGYKGGYSGGLTNATFSSDRDSMDLETLYTGLEGEQSSLNLRPPGKIVSNSSRKLESGNTLYSPVDEYNFSDWNRLVTDSDQVDPSDVDGEPDSDCYSSSSGLTRMEANFPDTSGVKFLNAEVGDCNGNRALKFDFDDDLVYESKVYLNGESFIVGGREYFININGACPSDPSASQDGECVQFIANGRELVELMPHTRSFDSFPDSAGRMALLGYENQYNEEQTKLIAASLHWLASEDYGFEGFEDSYDVDTSAFGSVDEEIYMPYTINLRWSQ